MDYAQEACKWCVEYICIQRETIHFYRDTDNTENQPEMPVQLCECMGNFYDAPVIRFFWQKIPLVDMFVNSKRKLNAKTRRQTDATIRKTYFLHKILNRIDAEKDAFYLKKRIQTHSGSKYFRAIANELFGDLNSYDKTVEQVANDISNLTYVYSTRINSLKDIDTKLYPTQVTHAVHDSGLSPFLLNPELFHILTPGSYLDSGNRNWDRNVVERYGFQIPINKHVFDSLSIPLKSLSSAQNEKSGSVTMTLEFDSGVIQPMFDKALNPQNDIARTLFRGNKEKNEWFDIYRDKPHAEILIVCKLLGDLLQAYYTKLYILHLIPEKRQSVLFFTCDKILVLRCKLFHVPVLYNTPLKDVRSMIDASMEENGSSIQALYYVPSSEDVTAPMKSYYKDHVITINNAIIRRIRNVIEKGTYKKKDGTVVLVSPEMVEHLNAINQHIRHKINEFVSINTQCYTVEEYQRVVDRYRAIELFDSKQEIFYSFHDSLFPEFQDTLLVPLRQFSQQGGGTESFSYNMTIENSDFTELPSLDPDENILEHVSVRHAVLNRIYRTLQHMFPDKSKDELCFLSDDMYTKLVRYYDFVGNNCIDPFFLAQCIRILMERDMMFVEYETMYSEYNQLRVGQHRTNPGEDILFPSVQRQKLGKAFGGRKRQTRKNRKGVHFTAHKRHSC